jgi:hypothetical protein
MSNSASNRVENLLQAHQIDAKKPLSHLKFHQHFCPKAQKTLDKSEIFIYKTNRSSSIVFANASWSWSKAYNFLPDLVYSKSLECPPPPKVTSIYPVWFDIQTIHTLFQQKTLWYSIVVVIYVSHYILC